MPSDQAMPKAHVRVPTHLQEAAEILAESRYTRQNKYSKGEVFREALRGYLASQEDLPEEAHDLLDEDHKSNAGGGSADDEVTA